MVDGKPAAEEPKPAWRGGVENEEKKPSIWERPSKKLSTNVKARIDTGLNGAPPTLQTYSGLDDTTAESLP